METKRFEIHFRTAARRGGPMGGVLRSAALADGLQSLDAGLQCTLVASAPPEVQDLLYMRVRNLAPLPEDHAAELDAAGPRRPDVLVVDRIPNTAAVTGLTQSGTIVVERCDGTELDDEGQVIACRVHRRDRPVQAITGDAQLLLDPLLPLLRARRRPVSRPPRELLILVGAGAHPLAELRIAEELAPLAAGFERIDFVTSFHANSAHLRQMARLVPSARIIPGVPRLAPLLARADLAILAGTTMAREAAALGTPAVLLSCTEKDNAHDAAFARHGCARHIGHHESIYPGKLTGLLRTLSADELATMAECGPRQFPATGLPSLITELRAEVTRARRRRTERATTA